MFGVPGSDVTRRQGLYMFVISNVLDYRRYESRLMQSGISTGHEHVLEEQTMPCRNASCYRVL
jgi:hypothetical protein